MIYLPNGQFLSLLANGHSLNPLSYLMQTQLYLSTTSQNDSAPLSCCWLPFRDLHPTVIFASLLIVCWFEELRGKNALGKPKRVMYFPLFAS